ncbi:hypothetical protein PHET_07576 [Paragonimus heterotremus]|uniref:Uncharacterized protein n=1 Tax=Paragonimus heterotremus TaxID=100268 RepID=A0A8J4SMZ0_9TREM|nr:hypothetical protein PHET_07576 [Paragonimus heterotremus]
MDAHLITCLIRFEVGTIRCVPFRKVLDLVISVCFTLNIYNQNLYTFFLQDNVLGISWKEERELRKAMYVSLRPQQRSTGYRLRLSSNSFRVRHPVKLPSVENSHQIGVIETNAYPLRWRHHRIAATADWTAESRLRKAKLRATASLSADAMSARKLVVAATSPSIQPSNSQLKKAVRVRKVGSTKGTSLSSITPLQSKADRVATNTRSTLRVPPRPLSQRVNVFHRSSTVRVSSLAKRPTLMSASNDLNKDSRMTCLRPVVLKQQRLQTPSKLDELCSLPVVPLDEPVEAPMPDPRPCLSPSDCDHAYESHTPSVNSVRNWPKPLISPKSSVLKSSRESLVSTAVRPQRKLFSDELLADASVKRTAEALPRELCQDPEGRPVSVHDFVEYICYEGTPCLNPRLQWFGHPRVAPCLPDAASNRTSITPPILQSLSTNHSPASKTTLTCLLPSCAAILSPKKTMSGVLSGPVNNGTPSLEIPVSQPKGTNLPSFRVAKKLAPVGSLTDSQVSSSCSKNSSPFCSNSDTRSRCSASRVGARPAPLNGTISKKGSNRNSKACK